MLNLGESNISLPSASELEETSSKLNKKQQKQSFLSSLRGFLGNGKNPFTGGINNQPTIIGHCLISGGLILVIGVSYVTLNSYADRQLSEWLKPRQRFDPVIENLEGTSAEKERLQEQIQELDQRVQTYAAIMKFFAKHYFVSISLAFASTVTSGICLFFVSKQGWERSHNSVINILIVSSVTAIFYYSLLGIFRQNENMLEAKKLYFAHISLQEQVRSYLVTGGIVTGTLDKPEFQKIYPNLFIHTLDQKMAELKQLPIEFDASRIPQVEDIVPRLEKPEKFISPSSKP